jgi:secreted trypsin-like serine protease
VPPAAAERPAQGRKAVIAHVGRVAVPLRLMLVAVLLALPAQAGAVGSVPVYGGDDAEPGTFGFMAALVSNAAPDPYLGQFCGGTHVAAEWVLTAAHCVSDLSPSDFHVLIGRTTLSKRSGHKRGVAEIVVHPEYDPDRVVNDVALVRLKRASSQPVLQLAAKADRSRWKGGNYVTVVGWGRWETTNPDFPDTLQVARVTIVSDGNCSLWWLIEPTLNVCAGGYKRGACVGDSGGPLMIDVSGRWKQVGVVSYGGPICGTGDDGYPPDVYSQVGTFPLKEWIKQQIN